MGKKMWFIGLVAIALLAVGCAQATPQVVEKEVTVVVTKEVPVEVTREVEVTRIVEVMVTPEPPNVPKLIEASLHHTTGGMAHWYSAENGGFEALTGIPYDDLSCKNCHVNPDDCSSCHVKQGGGAPPQSKCLACHGRQRAEIAQEVITDVHRDEMGFQCVTCHDANDVHGDGQVHNSMLEPGVIAADCADCHVEVAQNAAHSVHAENMDCAACHVQNVVSCYNCHFDTEVAEQKKVANRQVPNWKFLVKRDGKVTVGNVMTMVYQDKSFVALAPFYGHSVVKPDPETICNECHNSAIVKEYQESGAMTVTWWDEAEKKVMNYAGVIPVPSNFQEAMKFTFVTKDADGNWVFMKDTADAMQMLFAEPLDKMPPQFSQ
ncbi:MAG: hypothetical protein Kow0047_17590 [Anaerolineae bacterium]